jgi:hypothetical protein
MIWRALGGRPLILKTIALRTANNEYHQAARFWARIFAINFAMGVVTFRASLGAIRGVRRSAARS